MKNTILFLLLLLVTITFAQDKMITNTGKVTFEASVPSFEEVKALNENTSCVINTKTGEIASLALMKGFRFKMALMEKHFNENYIESSKYPKATFKGKIQNFDANILTSKARDYILVGKLELHGKSKDLNTIAKIKKTGEGIEIITAFNVNTDDFDITIPSLVKSKVSKNVNIRTTFLVQ